MSYQALLGCKNWVFDMDGTLTVAMHDFDAIRDELGLPEGLPILESLAQLPNEEAEPLHHRLNQIELDIAAEASMAEGVDKLLEDLLSRGANIGILTRNNKVNIDITLKAAKLDHYFLSENLLSRECAVPKPAADGILQLLKQWNETGNDSVMVGDHLHDLLAGHAAGSKTIYVDPTEDYIFAEHADVCIKSLTNLFN